MKAVIIGAGVAGLSIGWRLRQMGVEVTILERAQAARGATWASAGMIAATAELGEAQTPETALAYRARAVWPEFAREIEYASGIAIGYSEDGSLIVAADSSQADAFARRALADPDLEFLSAEEVRSKVPMLAPCIGALWAPKEAHVDNRALGRALACAFVRTKGNLVLNETVVRIAVNGNRAVAALTPAGLYEADVFILAAGAWSGLIDGLPPYAVPAVEPVKGEMLSLVPLQGAMPPACVIWGNGVYFVPRGEALLVGATLEDAGFDTRTTAAARDWLSSRAVALMPGVKDWRIAEHWAGLRPGSPDDLPLLGPSGVEGLLIASGQYRNGILFAPAVAEILSGLVLGRTTDVAAFDPRRFSGSLASPRKVR